MWCVFFFFLIGKVLSIKSGPLPAAAKQLIRSNTSIFFSSEMQYDENGCSCGQMVIGSFIKTITSHAEFFWQNIKSPRWLCPLQLRFGALWFWAFPQTKITFEREEISDCRWDSGKYDRPADGDSSCKGFCRVFWTVKEMPRELFEVPTCLLWRGLRRHCPVYKVSSILSLLQ